MKKKFTKLYPESGVELTPFISKHYDLLMNWGSFGHYHRFIEDAIQSLHIQPGQQILDLGCGTGRNASLMLPYLKNEGALVGLDVSPIMMTAFKQKFKGNTLVSFVQQRIDQPFDLKQPFDIVFISFVIHGFPQEVRQTIIDNAYRHLRTGGILAILDFAEFDMDKMPAIDRFVFRKIECPYAFDYISRDWKALLQGKGFNHFTEKHYIRKYVRLLQAAKIPE
jgi:demethylmenaquinone methyltransferase/2-methoxy-6-polyprenyl-1,4-benzoquinol methylase